MDFTPRWKMKAAACVLILLCGFLLVSAERKLGVKASELGANADAADSGKAATPEGFIWFPEKAYYLPVWPPFKFDWNMVLGTIIGFLGAVFGSVGGVGGGAIFVPMLTVIIGFDVKSSTAISKCMITGIAATTVCHKLKLRHPSLDLPLIDYDLALLFQPMLLLGISIGVALNIVFAGWMIIFLLAILSLGTATKAFFKAIETWKKETVIMRVAANLPVSDGPGEECEVEYKSLPSSQVNDSNGEARAEAAGEVPIIQNIRWKEFTLLVFVWVAFLVLQIIKDHTRTCSTWYWVLNFLQIPVAGGVSCYEAVNLYKGKRVVTSKGEQRTIWRVHQLVLYCTCGILAGIVGGLLGLGGSFILAPLFLELGIHPQVSSATATFAMAFSSTLSVVEYYMLERFPVPDAIYFVVVATSAAFLGQLVVRRLISIFGRASMIIFILAFMISVSAILLGISGIQSITQSIERHDYIGFEDRCKY